MKISRAAAPLFLLLALPAALALGPALPLSSPPLRALLVGGGPDPDHNQVAIESNVRYVRRLLPPKTVSRVLFANGNPNSTDVLYEDAKGNDHFERTDLPSLNGPSRLAAFDQQFHALRSQAGGPLLLYFTGHGGPGPDSYDNNEYDMWNNDVLTVKHLAAQIDTLPPKTHIVVVMVECFSGGFGNLLFQGGDPQGAPLSQDLCGFFASVPSRVAAGCTPEVDQADYHDFTSYFFAALSGRDRLGRSVTGADYNHDGIVGMDEAYAYALIHDISIDTPTCTSDIFLRRFVKVPDQSAFTTSYSDVLQWATPGQRAVLDSLSQILGYHMEDRLAQAYAMVSHMTGDGDDEDDPHNARVIRFVRTAHSVVLAHALQSSTDSALKARYAELTAAEAQNPLRGA